MGLDISYYTDIEKFEGKVETNEYGNVDWKWMEDNKLVKLVPFDAYRDRADGVKGIHSYNHFGGFRAGSYSGYNRYRELLAITLLKVTGKTGSLEPEITKDNYHDASKKVWNNEHVFEGEPFYEQISFADNEGVIGPDTSEKLAEDYNEFESEFQETVEKRFGEEKAEYYMDKYDEWKTAFNQVAGNGAVRFG